MTRDLNKGISGIQYNLLNLPRQVDLKSPVAEARVKYTYRATGEKIAVEQTWNPNYSTAPVIGSAINASSLTLTKTTEYSGDMIFENGALKTILIDGGYIRDGVYYFYVTGHLGNNYMVVNQNGEIVQKNQYYPGGMSFADDINQGEQQCKYNGKELEPMHGVNLYDSKKRFYDFATGRFTTMDQFSEKYYSMSPYCAFGNNPMRNIDINGDSITVWAMSANGDMTRYYYGQASDGNYGFLDGNGKMYSGDDSFMSSLTDALGKLRTGGSVGESLVNELMSSTKNVEMQRTNNDNGASPSGAFIRWNPNNLEGGVSNLFGQIRPPFIGLSHEMAHIQDIWNGTLNKTPWNGTDLSEGYATHIENQIRAENGISLRRSYANVKNENIHFSADPNTRLIDNNGRSIYNGASYFRTIRVGGFNIKIPFNQ